jgi:hypothetical protein
LHQLKITPTADFFLFEPFHQISHSTPCFFTLAVVGLLTVLTTAPLVQTQETFGSSVLSGKGNSSFGSGSLSMGLPDFFGGGGGGGGDLGGLGGFGSGGSFGGLGLDMGLGGASKSAMAPEPPTVCAKFISQESFSCFRTGFDLIHALLVPSFPFQMDSERMANNNLTSLMAELGLTKYVRPLVPQLARSARN